MKAAKQDLAVWIEGRRVGTLTARHGQFGFQYHPEWLAHDGGFPLSPHMPLCAEPYADDAADRRLAWFFDNLLPEGGIRQALAQHAHLHPQDGFGLLAQFGRESAGALTLLPEGEPWDSRESYRPLSTDELRRLIADLPRVPLIAAGGKGHMSLAGAQHKLALHRRDEAFLLPERGASSVIIKPDNARIDDFPFCPANEHFCLSLARQLRIPAPTSALLHLPEPIYIVDRFDRHIDADGRVSRLHQLDLCQALNQPASLKYEGQGGITFVQAFAALEQTRQPAVSRNQLLRWLVFNFIIGNSDAHAKNVAFLLSARGMALAPAYDLLSVSVYGEAFGDMAMTIGEQVRYGWVDAQAWDALAREIRIQPEFLRRLRRELASSTPARARALLTEDVSFTPPEREFLGRIVEVIDRHAGYVLETV